MKNFTLLIRDISALDIFVYQGYKPFYAIEKSMWFVFVKTNKETKIRTFNSIDSITEKSFSLN